MPTAAQRERSARRRAARARRRAERAAAGRTGRPSTYDPAVAARITAGVADGLAWSTACGLEGVDKDAAERWRRTHEDFREAVAKAEHDVKARNELKIQVGRPQWQAAAWWLERRHAPEYGRRLAFTGAGDPTEGTPYDLMVIGYMARKRGVVRRAVDPSRDRQAIAPTNGTNGTPRATRQPTTTTPTNGHA
jgi:hypothetical protein